VVRPPYRKQGKNDANDAAAICEAVARPNMHFVAPKTEEQQAVLMVHRARSLAVANRTAQVNQIRGLLSEFGIVMALGIARVRS
jgi:transposase